MDNIDNGNCNKVHDCNNSLGILLIILMALIIVATITTLITLLIMVLLTMHVSVPKQYLMEQNTAKCITNAIRHDKNDRPGRSKIHETSVVGD